MKFLFFSLFFFFVHGTTCSDIERNLHSIRTGFENTWSQRDIKRSLRVSARFQRLIHSRLAILPCRALTIAFNVETYVFRVVFRLWSSMNISPFSSRNSASNFSVTKNFHKVLDSLLTSFLDLVSAKR